MCGRWLVAMSRTKARVISSLRMRRCSQRRKMTNCTATGTSVVSQPMPARQLELGMSIGIVWKGHQEGSMATAKDESSGLCATRYSQMVGSLAGASKFLLIHLATQVFLFGFGALPNHVADAE